MATESERASRWSFELATPLGTTRCSFEIGPDALRFQSDDLFGGGSQAIPWDSIAEGGTAAMAGMGGRGGPDFAAWAPEHIEWLTLSRTAGGGEGFVRMLPPGGDRDAIVAAVRERLGPRWIGERIPLKEAQQRLHLSSKEWSTFKVVGLVAAVLGLLVLSIIVLGLLLTPFVIVPVGLVAGAWLVRKGVRGHRDSMAAASVPIANAGHGPAGLVHLRGCAITAEPTISPVSGRSGVRWDAAVLLWYEGDSENVGGWRQVAARFGGTTDLLELETDDGVRLPVWLQDAELVFERRSWESEKDSLPAAGLAWLDALGFPWNGQQKLMVTEECVEEGATLHVFGTLDERRHLPESFELGRIDRIRNAVRSGSWRRSVTAAMPPPLRPVVAVFIGFLDLFTRVGTAKARPRFAGSGMPPALPPDARLVWKGRSGHLLLVSDQPEAEALAALRQRSLVVGGVGAAIVCFAIYTLFEASTGA